jgi:hypothetical protein
MDDYDPPSWEQLSDEEDDALLFFMPSLSESSSLSLGCTEEMSIDSDDENMPAETNLKPYTPDPRNEGAMRIWRLSRRVTEVQKEQGTNATASASQIVVTLLRRLSEDPNNADKLARVHIATMQYMQLLRKNNKVI